MVMVSFFSMIFIGCSIKDDFVSPSRVAIENIDTYKKEKKDFIGTQDLIIIGHQAGSYYNYPMKIENNEVVGNDGKRAVFNVNDLIDRAFDDFELDGVEVDIVAPPKKHPLCLDGEWCGFVVHDVPTKDAWNEVAKLKNSRAYYYLQNNTLKNVLESFIAKGHHKNKRLYLEVKVPSLECMLDHKDNKNNCFDSAYSVVNQIQKLYEDNKQLAAVSNDWLYVVSFSPNALKIIKNQLKNDKLKYGLILGYDTKDLLGKTCIKGYLAQTKGPVPEIDDNIINFINNNQKFIDTIWFSVKGISEPDKLFKKFKNKKLHYSVSTYDVKEKKLQKRLCGVDLSSIESIMIDVDD
jgi:glycerophosphoryl diester phosphodiesterase